MDWRLFGSTFLLIFIAELPDKTALASVFLATNNRPAPVFAGAAAAFLIHCLIAVSFGRLLGLLPPRAIHIGAGAVFLILAIVMWRRVPAHEDFTVKKRASWFNTSVSAFAVIFIAEWGDLTQFAIATVSAKYSAPFTIFAAGTLALWAVAGIGVVIGHVARRSVQPQRLQKIAAVTFGAVGLVLLVR